MVAMTTVLSFIEKEMRKNINTQPAKKIRDLLGIDFMNVVSPATQIYDIGQAMQIWKSMVNYGKPWDHKPMLKKKFGDWSHDGVTGKDYFFDIWSNIHYGYVGRSVGFSMWTLKSGAGYAQYKAGTNPSGYWQRRAKKWGDADFLAAFDDPKDQAAIDLGGKLWEDKKATFTHQDFVDRVRARVSDLSTR
ncbi:MAG: hypothetical protein GVY13_10625 [Alphaproteobacteria bacterium]|jgi:hypothetical protein|nr:hypothetical protein [Alphaproteobacteria bacterium]